MCVEIESLSFFLLFFIRLIGTDALNVECEVIYLDLIVAQVLLKLRFYWSSLLNALNSHEQMAIVHN